MLSFQIQHLNEDLDLNISADIGSGVTALFGPSGGGKTSLLRSIAGLNQATGSIVFKGQTWLDTQQNINVPTHKRPVGLMFQDARLFPHLNVEENLRFAQSRQRSRALPFDDAIEILELSNLLHRDTSRLSGGEKQRVALARTVLSGPELLLLDEPLAAIDLERKYEILPYVEKLSRMLAVPTIYVSHSVDEVIKVADYVIAIDDGRRYAAGPPIDIFSRLDLEDLTGHFDAGVIVRASVINHEERLQLTNLALDGQSIAIPIVGDIANGKSLSIRIRARDVSLALSPPSDISIRNVLKARIAKIVENKNTPYAEVFVDLGEQTIRSRITRAATEALHLQDGQQIYALIKSVTLDTRNL